MRAAQSLDYAAHSFAGVNFGGPRPESLMEEVIVEQSASSRVAAVPGVSQSPKRSRSRETAKNGVLVTQVKRQNRVQSGGERAVPAVVRVTKANRTREI